MSLLKKSENCNKNAFVKHVVFVTIEMYNIAKCQVLTAGLIINLSRSKLYNMYHQVEHSEILFSAHIVFF
jgi:hypothetical protein